MNYHNMDIYNIFQIIWFKFLNSNPEEQRSRCGGRMSVLGPGPHWHARAKDNHTHSGADQSLRRLSRHKAEAPAMLIHALMCCAYTCLTAFLVCISVSVCVCVFVLCSSVGASLVSSCVVSLRFASRAALRSSLLVQVAQATIGRADWRPPVLGHSQPVSPWMHS